MDKSRKYSHTSLSSFRRCRQRYFWSYVKNLAPPTSMGLVRGSVGHHALATWYLVGDRQEAFQAASDKLTEYERELNTQLDEEWDLISLVLSRYFDWAEINDDFTVQATEQRFDLPLSDHTVIGYIDGIATKADGVMWLLEHKFQKQARTKHLSLDPQSSMYIWAARRLGYNVRGVLYNVIRMTKGGIAAREPVVRLPVYRNNEALEFIEQEMIQQMNEMRDFHAGKMSMFRNPTRDCSWDCSFYDVCLGINDNGQAQPILNTYPEKQYGGTKK